MYTHRACASLLAFVLVTTSYGGCDGGDTTDTTTPDEVGATLALSPAAVTVTAGASVDVTAEIVRFGGFEGDIVVEATNAPSDLVVTGGTIAGGETSIVLTVSVLVAATAGAHEVTIGGTADGVTIEPVTLGVTIVGQEAAIVPFGNVITAETAGDDLGSAVALSADGARLAVGSYTSDGAGTDAGHARVYDLSGDVWVQLGSDVDGEADDEHAGWAVALSADGVRLAVGAPYADANLGTVRVYDWSGTAWVKVGANIVPLEGSGFGSAIAMSTDGTSIVAGAPAIGGITGYASVYDLVGDTWTRRGVALTVAGSIDLGTAVAMSADGDRIAVGIPGSSGGDRPGTTIVYDWDGLAWVAVGGSILGEANGDGAGSAVALSADGARVAIGAPSNKDAGGGAAGQVRVYDLVGSVWTQTGSDIDGLSGACDGFGSTVAMAEDGGRLIGTCPSNSLARVYDLVGGEWTQLGEDVTGGTRSLGLAISADALVAAVGFVNSQEVYTYLLLAPAN